MDNRLGYGAGLFDETATNGSRGLFIVAVVDVGLVGLALLVDANPALLGSLLIIPALVAPILVWIDVGTLATEENWTWGRLPTTFAMFLAHGLFLLFGFLFIMLYFLRRSQAFQYDSVEPTTIELEERPRPLSQAVEYVTNSDDDSPKPESWESKQREQEDKRPWE